MIKLWHCIRRSVCVILKKLWSFRYSWTWFVITLSDSDVCDECCQLDVTVNGDRWTYYDLGCTYELWFEILRDFTDYRDYMGISLMVWLSKGSLFGLISYNLSGSVTPTMGISRGWWHGMIDVNIHQVTFHPQMSPVLSIKGERWRHMDLWSHKEQTNMQLNMRSTLWLVGTPVEGHRGVHPVMEGSPDNLYVDTDF